MWEMSVGKEAVVMNQAYCPTVNISRALESELAACCLDGAPREVCGLLFGTMRPDGLTITRFQRLQNVSPTPERHFAFTPEDWVTFLYGRSSSIPGSLEELLGIFHSHPSGPAVPSREDMMLQWEFQTYAIVSLCEKKPLLRCYYPQLGEQWHEQRVMIHNGSDGHTARPDW